MERKTDSLCSGAHSPEERQIDTGWVGREGFLEVGGVLKNK